MHGWIETLADKVHRQGEHIPQHYYILHNHQSLNNLHCYLCRDGSVKCSSDEDCALLVCVLCQPVLPSNSPYIWYRFFVRNLYNFLFLLALNKLL